MVHSRPRQPAEGVFDHDWLDRVPGLLHAGRHLVARAGVEPVGAGLPGPGCRAATPPAGDRRR